MRMRACLVLLILAGLWLAIGCIYPSRLAAQKPGSHLGGMFVNDHPMGLPSETIGYPAGTPAKGFSACSREAFAYAVASGRTPDLRGCQAAAVEPSINAVLKMTPVEIPIPSNEAAGIVVRQTPAANDPLPRGGTFTLNIPRAVSPQDVTPTANSSDGEPMDTGATVNTQSTSDGYVGPVKNTAGEPTKPGLNRPTGSSGDVPAGSSSDGGWPGLVGWVKTWAGHVTLTILAVAAAVGLVLVAAALFSPLPIVMPTPRITIDLQVAPGARLDWKGWIGANVAPTLSVDVRLETEQVLATGMQIVAVRSMP